MSDQSEAWSDAYNYLYENDLVANPCHYVERLNEAYDKKDIKELEKIYDDLHLPKKKLYLEWYRHEIFKVIGCHYHEIEDILNAIKTHIEADIVLECVEGSEWILSLPNEKISKYSYSKQVKAQRRKLEKELAKLHVGINRAKKISQIVLSI